MNFLEWNNWIKDEKELTINSRKYGNRTKTYNNNNSKDLTQFRCFQKAMKILLITGQCLGLLPVTALLNHDISKIRFRLNSWKFVYTAIVAIMQTIVAVCYFNKLLDSNLSIKSLKYFSYSTAALSTTITFVHIASKWRTLVKALINCNLDKYVNSGIIIRCRVYCIVLLLLAIVEYVLYFAWRISQIFDCTRNQYSIDEEIVRRAFPWYFETGLPYNKPIAVVLVLNHFNSALIWNFPNICIICISLYLTSILNEINKSIIWAADKNYLYPSIWGTLREDYSRATRLVRLFDDLFSGIILVTFADSLFFICFQLFNVLENGIGLSPKIAQVCPHYTTGPFHGYERPIHTIFSMIHLMGRFLTVCLIAAKVNVTSLVPATALNRIPCCAYTIEVQRFLDQVNDDIVALTGLNFFYITNELIVSVTGTILTYEIVLLQFNSEELNKF